MSYFVQYHNLDKQRLNLTYPPFSATRLCIHTRRPNVKGADGQVFLVAGIGHPRQFFLWETFTIEEVMPKPSGLFEASGTGWQLAPPAALEGKSFDEFKAACANFVGFRCTNDLPYTRTLRKLADLHRTPGNVEQIVDFLWGLYDLVDGDHRGRDVVRRALTHYGEPVLALSVRQPHAEAIMRGVKKIEYRSSPTQVRGRIHIYASLGRYTAAKESELMAGYGINDMACDDLPRGVLLGTVELFACDGGEWHLRNPERDEVLPKPAKQPQPVWFCPY